MKLEDLLIKEVWLQPASVSATVNAVAASNTLDRADVRDCIQRMLDDGRLRLDEDGHLQVPL